MARTGAVVVPMISYEHYARSKAAGATILSPLGDAVPGRRYRAKDVEGHRWMFLQPGPSS
jgi:uncharacterized glyoxalase superfamily protein PhnB